MTEAEQITAAIARWEAASVAEAAVRQAFRARFEELARVTRSGAEADRQAKADTGYGPLIAEFHAADDALMGLLAGRVAVRGGWAYFEEHAMGCDSIERRPLAPG